MRPEVCFQGDSRSCYTDSQYSPPLSPIPFGDRRRRRGRRNFQFQRWTPKEFFHNEQFRSFDPAHREGTRPFVNPRPKMNFFQDGVRGAVVVFTTTSDDSVLQRCGKSLQRLHRQLEDRSLELTANKERSNVSDSSLIIFTLCASNYHTHAITHKCA